MSHDHLGRICGEDEQAPQFDQSKITAQLSKSSYIVNTGLPGLNRSDGARLASNVPCEDRFSRAQDILLWGDTPWVASAVFDGHSGSQTAEFLEHHLLEAVRKELLMLEPQKADWHDLVNGAIKCAFTSLDRAIIDNFVNSATTGASETLDRKMKHMMVAMAGSCALLCLYDPSAGELYTACVGDSRAILVKQEEDGHWTETALSVDQDGNNEAEIARLQGEHPGEDTMIANGRVLGLSVTRAFGNAHYKLSREACKDLSAHLRCPCSIGEKHLAPTPPYLTAEPVVQVTTIHGPAFVVLATDGVWTMCENREVKDLVVRWLEAQPDAVKKTKLTPSTSWWKTDPAKPQPRPAADYAPGFTFKELWSGFDMRFRDERTVIRDLDNVAVHLLRNACGGNHEELLVGYLAMQAPFARAVRDDLTVQVLFFNMPFLS